MESSKQSQLPFESDSLPAAKAAGVMTGANPIESTAPASLAGGHTELRGRVADHAPMLLTARDVEAELQLGRTRTYELIRSGALPVVRLGRVVRVPRDALRRWIDDHCAPTPP